MKCPVCSTDNAAGEEFCINCGAALNQPAPTSGAGSVTSSGNAGSVTYGGSGGGTSRTLAPNATLENGRYVIQKLLGQGGMGTAMLAKDTRVSNKLVVIKELISDNTDPTQRQEDVRNFEREVETLAQIDHPLVPNVTDSFHEGTHYFMVQEYVPGENLEDRMDRVNAPMPEREALGYASQVLDILDNLSQQNPPIVHRDIKPANIIIGSKDKRAHLVDFGIARAAEAKNAKRKQTSALGTPGYAPPEQYQGNADARSDMYALAATIHHLVTNRDPRNYPPFNYPSPRSINPQVSPETDRILTKALNIDVNKRYQTPAEMKRDVDGVLTRKFNLAGDTSSYVLGTSGPLTVAPTPQPSRPQPAQPARTAQRPPSQPPAQPRQPQPVRSAYPAQQAPRPAPYPQQQAPMYVNQGAHQGGGTGFVRSSLLLLFVVLLLGVGLFLLPNILKSRNNGGAATPATGGSGAGATPTAAFTAPSSGIGVQPFEKDFIGISDGTYAFDTTSPRTDGDLKTQAASALKSGDTGGASSLLRQAVSSDPNDAEAQIYLEDQNVLASGKPYVTLVVGTMLSQDNIGVGRDDLQGAYIAQREYNAGKLNGGTKVRLLIASSGSTSSYANPVAQQIVQLAKSDKTFVGVMGWPFSSRTEAAISILRAAHIPMVSQTSSSDSLTGTSAYFFRVAPANKSQGIEGAKYAESTLHAKNVALFVDYSDAYSQSLANDFVNQFQQDGNKVIVTEQYKVNAQDSSLPGKLQDALSKKPDMIYFSGYAADVSTLLSNLPNNSLSIPILGGDALYELGGYSSGARDGLKYLKFTAFFYPDVWTILNLNNSPKKPAFFSDFSSVYGAGGRTGYSFTRADSDATLSYDATVALLTAYNIAAPSGGQITPDALRNALTKTSFQGASGQISFDSNGDPVNKAIVILKVDDQGRIGLDKQVGTFLQ